MKKEDDELYPTLREMAKDDQNLKLKLESLAGNLGDVTSAVAAFFEKYAEGEHEADFKADFQKIYLILSRRINSEERELFPEYEKSVPFSKAALHKKEHTDNKKDKDF